MTHSDSSSKNLSNHEILDTVKVDAEIITHWYLSPMRSDLVTGIGITAIKFSVTNSPQNSMFYSYQNGCQSVPASLPNGDIDFVSITLNV